MPSPEKLPPTQVKDEHNRTLRSASPAIKRPASDMGAQDREDHSTDVEMGDVADNSSGPSQNEAVQDLKLKQENGKRMRSDEASPDDVSPDDATHTGDSRIASQNLSTDDTSSTPANSVVPSSSKSSTATASTATSLYEPSVPADQLPSIDEQVQKVRLLANEELQDKQKGYVVSSKWLRRVQARSSFASEDKSVDKSATEGVIGPVDNSDIAMVIEDSDHLKDEAGEKFVEFSPHLTQGEDFEILPQKAWDLVISWYGLARTSPVITRYAHQTSDGEMSNIIYELHPPIWSFLKVPAAHTPQTQREKDQLPQRMLDSRYTPVQRWLKQAKELVGIPLSTKVRVWRILGGLKSTTASGILTPAASRSASPAPGAELIASAGDRLLLDVNTFAALQIGEHRELQEVKDHTNDPKYNGKVTLATLGLGRNDVIVLEEQSSKNEEWPSENVKLSINKNLTLKSKTLTASGRSSPAPGIMTRGRQRRDGRPKGITGLSNLGNTCYMNSALQSIRSVEELTQYFLMDKWKQDLNTNNPLGHHGNVAKAYADLIHQIYGDSTGSSCNPSRFKATVGKYGPSFAGYGQQDSQEFLLFLLDGLQEDLNRIQKKPYIEKPDSTDEMVHDQRALKEFADKNWEIYKARNDSVITDLFAGMYKSTVTCPVCDKVSIIFDPFNNLTLQLPIENNWSKQIIYFPIRGRPYKVDVDIDKMSTFAAVKEYVAKRTHYDPAKMILAESYQNKFYRTFSNVDTIAEVNIADNEIICMYELESVPTNYNPNKRKKRSIYLSYRSDNDDDLVALDSPEADRLLVPVFHRLVKRGERRVTRPFFAHPSYIVVDRQDSASYERILKRLLAVADNMTTKNILDEDQLSGAGAETPEDSDTVVMTDDGSSSDPKAASIQGEDGFVDISMRDASQPPAGDAADGGSDLPRVLQPGVHVPQVLQGLFDIRIAATGEGIPLGNNSLEESKEYADITERMPQPVTVQADDEIMGQDLSSEDELEDIHYKESPTPNDSASESGNSADPKSDNESDDSLPQTASDIIKDTRGLKNRKNKKTYGRRDRQKHHAAAAPRQKVLPQPLPQPRPAMKTVRDSSKPPALIQPGDAILLDWDEDAYEALFSGSEAAGDDEMRGAPTWEGSEVLEDQDLTKKRTRRQQQTKNGVTLEDCLNEFGKEETLSEQNAWYCPRCKEHRRAKKMFELWKSPDILVMHLKRFSSNRNFRDKLEFRVDYPVEGLDLSNMVRDQTDGKSLIYDLIAVDNHYGGLGGGHYTAYAKNFINDTWYDFNDSHVSQKDSSSLVTSAAYLLFYRRRTDGPLGGPSLARVLGEADSEEITESRDGSPSGEGQRLDDSSRNGLSSAYQAGQVHLAGDGGPAAPYQDQSLEVANPSIATLKKTSDTELPSYDTVMAGSQDDGVNLDSPALWNPEPQWSFESLQGVAGPANSVEEFDNSSTRGEGASPPASLPDDTDDDRFMHSEDIEEYHRSMRASGPPPDMPDLGAVHVEHHVRDRKEDDNDDDDDDTDLPVQELHPGQMEFTPAPEK